MVREDRAASRAVFGVWAGVRLLDMRQPGSAQLFCDPEAEGNGIASTVQPPAFENCYDTQFAAGRLRASCGTSSAS